MIGASTAAVAAGVAGASLARAQEATPTPHHTGPNPFEVEGSEISVRRSATSLSPEERATYVHAVLALKKKPSEYSPGLSVYDTFVAWHRDAFGCAIMSAHMGPAFLPWHRVFLRLFELELQKVEPTATVPYWDWTVDNGTEGGIWTDDFMGGDGDPNAEWKLTSGPFNTDAWEIKIFDYGDQLRTPSIVRSFGQGFSATLPTPEEVEQVLSVSTYDSEPWNSMVHPTRSFRNAIEGWRDCVDELCDPDTGMGPVCAGPHPMHNGVHLWVAGEQLLTHQIAMPGQDGEEPEEQATPTDLIGTMAFNSSPNDPVFFLHHANIDRLWEVWMQRHGKVYAPESGGPVGHNLNDLMWPYHHYGLEVSPAMTFDPEAMGFRYE
jgi:tyrosinase